MTTNLTIKQTIASNDIKIQIPYTISASFGMLLTVLFVVAQLIEMRNNDLFRKKSEQQMKPLKKVLCDENEFEYERPKSTHFLQKLFLLRFGLLEFSNHLLNFLVFSLIYQLI